MRRISKSHHNEAGQTLVIALIVMGVLLAMGFVFLGIIGRNVTQTAVSQRRSLASELARAGVTFAHQQLLTSVQGADWRPAYTPLSGVAGNPDLTRDPDAFYLRPGSGFGWRSDADPQVDLGGPDGLGPYTRADFGNGRTLIRVRYGPSDANVFSTAATGPLRNPGRARMYTIIESVGRPGRVAFNDPTYVGGRALQFQNYADGDAFRAAVSDLRKADAQNALTSKAVAFASIPTIESLLYVSNKDKSNQKMDLGIDSELNVIYKGVDIAKGEEVGTGTQVTTPLALEMGGDIQAYNFGDASNPPTPAIMPVGIGGSVYSNADIRVHGNVFSKLAGPLGDGIFTSGLIFGADNASRLHIESHTVNTAGVWQPGALISLGNQLDPSLNSRSGAFVTHGGLVRDGIATSDAQGYSRGVGNKAAPSIQAVDPDTGQTRYRLMTAESGEIIGGRNSGLYGHGRNVYVNNGSDRQIAIDEKGREQLGTAQSLIQDWLNPNSGQAGSAWQGPFYVPRGAFLQLREDGFVIVRDARAPERERYWRGRDGGTPVDSQGNPVQTTFARFRLGLDSGGVLKIVNSFTPDPLDNSRSIDIDAASINFDDAGEPFNGVLFFEGNVRVRGTIPTNVQLSVVSNSTIYIEGSITKGVDRVGLEPSRSMIALMAKDYVALNTTMFFGASPGQALEEANEAPSAVAYNPVRVRQPAGGIGFVFELPLNPESAMLERDWRPYALDYKEFSGPGVDSGAPLATRVLLTHTMDDGPAPATFMQMNVSYGLDNPLTPPPADPDDVDWVYQFFMSDSNAATQPYIDAGFAPGGYIPMYGLGVDSWQRYPKFETTSFPLLDSNFAFDTPSGMLQAPAANPYGTYALFAQSTNDLSLVHTTVSNLPTNDYLLARAAITPHDIRIEASIYAEDGSFFVIPGPPFNPNPNDRRELFEQAVNNYGGFGDTAAVERALRERLENFGTFPETPFYGEPLDVKITLVGAIAQNMTPSIDQQSHWVRRWGWIPAQSGAMFDFSVTPPRPVLIPSRHVPPGYDIRPEQPTHDLFVPNLVLSYDPRLATARVEGFDPASAPVRTDDQGRVLPPLPRLPVSPSLAYFGEVGR